VAVSAAPPDASAEAATASELDSHALRRRDDATMVDEREMERFMGSLLER
jgi:hypothetical protein